MNYFTPQLFARLQAPTAAQMDAADAEWEAAEVAYEGRLQQLGPAIEPVLRQFEGVLLHDAAVQSISRAGDRFTIVLQKDVPPQDVVTLTYALTGEPFLDENAVPPPYRGETMLYQYDELDLEQDGDRPVYVHSMLFSNGWEVRLRFRALRVELAQPIYPLPANRAGTFLSMGASQSA